MPPAGNRNPEPDEIAACEPFLGAQIAAISPKVIVALGKFAAQTLLRDTTPISRLRGQLGELRRREAHAHVPPGVPPPQPGGEEAGVGGPAARDEGARASPAAEVAMLRSLAARLRTLAAAALVAAPLSLAAPSAPSVAAGAPRVLTLEIRGPITGGTAEYVAAGLRKARAGGYAVLAIALDTPGGALDATREIVQAMLGSQVPILVWVGPAGARAGSAGVFITLAADVAAMHPTSNIGAAHPVTGSGRDVAEEAGKDMAKKVENDTAAFARSVAAARGRNADWAEKAVRESVGHHLDGRGEGARGRLHFGGAAARDRGRRRPQGEDRRRGEHAQDPGAVLEPYEKTIRQKVLSFLADPNVVAILMLVGTLGIALELYNPGSVLPGVVGGFALFLAFVGMRVIPVNVGAVILLLVGAALLVAEAYVTTHGLAGDRRRRLPRARARVLRGSRLARLPVRAGRVHGLAVDRLADADHRRARARLHGLEDRRRAQARRCSSARRGSSAARGRRCRHRPAGGEAFVHGEYWQARSAAPIPRGRASASSRWTASP